MASNQNPLSHEDKEKVFRIATRSLPKRYKEQILASMTDDDLIAALELVLGIFGGSCGPNTLSVTHQSAGLKIWGGWHSVNHITEASMFQSRRTLAMARLLYGIADPANKQTDLF